MKCECGLWKPLQNKAKLLLGLSKCYIESIFEYEEEANPEAREADLTSENDLMKIPEDISENDLAWKESSESYINWYLW